MQCAQWLRHHPRPRPRPTSNIRHFGPPFLTSSASILPTSCSLSAHAPEEIHDFLGTAGTALVGALLVIRVCKASAFLEHAFALLLLQFVVCSTHTLWVRISLLSRKLFVSFRVHRIAAVRAVLCRRVRVSGVGKLFVGDRGLIGVGIEVVLFWCHRRWASGACRCVSYT